MSDEKRKQPRFLTKQRLWREGQDDKRFGETRNISKGGMFIVGDDTTEVGQELEVSLQGGDGNISLKLEVMWKGQEEAHGPQGLGVRIVDFGESKDVYSKLLDKLQSGAAAPQEGQEGQEGQDPANTARNPTDTGQTGTQTATTAPAGRDSSVPAPE